MRAISLLLLSLAYSHFAAAQSFDCKLAKSPREHAVCSDSKLAALDTAVSAAYKSLRAQLSPESAALVQSDQREWLHWLDLVCPAHGKGVADNINRCLTDEYSIREDDFNGVLHIGSAVVFPRSHFVYEAGDSIEHPGADTDPGFGYGSLRWPQIDIQPGRSNLAYAAWNDAVKKRAIETVLGHSDKNASFDAAVDGSGTTEVFYSVEAANDRFIDVSFLSSSFGWGAAHPLTDETSFLWWLDRGRELTANDVFLPNSGWQHDLIQPVIRILKANDPNQLFEDRDAELTAAVAPAIPRTHSWSLSSKGLTIIFGQYEIGPYAAGMPEAHIPWSDLKPYLAPALQPATLPAPAPKPNR